MKINIKKTKVLKIIKGNELTLEEKKLSR